jgi:hypothetical protein
MARGGQFNKYVGNICDRYSTYLREVVGKPNALLVSYEEMVLNFGDWLTKLLSAFKLPDSDGTCRFVTARHAESVKPAGENVWSHKRKVTPGDYKEKLRPETITTLNSRFNEVLDAVSYSDPQYETKQIPTPRLAPSHSPSRW